MVVPVWSHVGNVMNSMGTQDCDGSPCAFNDKAKDLLIVVYGDDFVAVGFGDALLNFETELSSHISMARKAFIGHEEGDDRSGRILNRITSLDDAGLYWEADPRHAELTVRGLGLEAARPQNTPKSSRDDLIDAEPLNPEAARACRGVTARVNYLALNMPELLFAAK